MTGARFPTRGLATSLSIAALALPAAAMADNGGTPAGGFVLSTPTTLYLGHAMRIAGESAGAGGKTIEIDARRARGAWAEIASVKADSNGAFRTTWRPPAYGEFQLRAVAGGAAHASRASYSVPRDVVVYRSALATWYGPGFYGRRTACGRRLTRALVGVANRRLRCGTKVQIVYRGRTIVAPVVDRGPFGSRAQWDLTGAAARRLGMAATSRIGAAPLDLSLQPPGL